MKKSLKNENYFTDSEIDQIEQIKNQTLVKKDPASCNMKLDLNSTFNTIIPICPKKGKDEETNIRGQVIDFNISITLD